MEEKAEKIENIYNAVMYTDGSCYSPLGNGIGYTGSSAHGYIYSHDNIGVPNKDNPSSNLFTTIKGYANVLSSEHKVTPDSYLDMAFVYDAGQTNNVAEIKAIYNAIDYLLKLDKKFNTIYIKSDSSYALHIYNETMYGSPTDIENKKNGDLWVAILAQVELARSKEVKLVLIKVPGHAGILGNEIADSLAKQARVMSEKVIEKTDESLFKDYVLVSSGKKYWKTGKEKNPFLTVKSLFFTSDLEKNEFAIMDYPTNKEIGVGTNDALFGMLFVKNSTPEFEDINHIISLNNKVTKGYDTLSEVNMATFYSRIYEHYKKMFGEEIYRPNKNKSGINVLTLPISGRTFQGLAKLAFNKTITLKNSYVNFIKHEANEEIKDVSYIDITDMIYEVNPKGKKVCTVSQLAKSIDFKTKVDGKDVKICLMLGIELLARNNLKRLEKEIKSVKLELVRKNKVLETTVIIDTENITACYTNLYTRYIVLK